MGSLRFLSIFSCVWSVDEKQSDQFMSETTNDVVFGPKKSEKFGKCRKSFLCRFWCFCVVFMLFYYFTNFSLFSTVELAYTIDENFRVHKMRNPLLLNFRWPRRWLRRIWNLTYSCTSEVCPVDTTTQVWPTNAVLFGLLFCEEPIPHRDIVLIHSFQKLYLSRFHALGGFPPEG